MHGGALFAITIFHQSLWLASLLHMVLKFTDETIETAVQKVLSKSDLCSVANLVIFGEIGYLFVKKVHFGDFHVLLGFFSETRQFCYFWVEL